MMTYPFSKLGFCLIAGKFVRGLDNAGKTTIVKRINGEDTSSISPTLGFNIKTMQYNRYAAVPIYGSIYCSSSRAFFTELQRLQQHSVHTFDQIGRKLLSDNKEIPISVTRTVNLDLKQTLGSICDCVMPKTWGFSPSLWTPFVLKFPTTKTRSWWLLEFGVPSFRLNIWDVGGQKTLRSYWRNYYEQTDGMVWVVDSSDLRRLNDCRHELHGLLKQEVILIILQNPNPPSS